MGETDKSKLITYVSLLAEQEMAQKSQGEFRFGREWRWNKTMPCGDVAGTWQLPGGEGAGVFRLYSIHIGLPEWVTQARVRLQIGVTDYLDAVYDCFPIALEGKIYIPPCQSFLVIAHAFGDPGSGTGNVELDGTWRPGEPPARVI